MKRLKAQAAEQGYHTIDWNVSAEDAVGGHPSAEKILHNITKDAKSKEICVVLMHDTKATRTTVEALPDIIVWFRDNGINFARWIRFRRRMRSNRPALTSSPFLK